MIKIVLFRRCLLQNILSNVCVYIYMCIYIYIHTWYIGTQFGIHYKIFILEESLQKSLYKHYEIFLYCQTIKTNILLSLSCDAL